MKRQITVFELIRLVLAVALAAGLFIVLQGVGRMLAIESVNILSFVIDLILVLVIPAFLAVFIGCVLPSWRYKTIAATIMLAGLTFTSLLDVFLSLSSLMDAGFAMVLLSATMTGALAAALAWNRLKAGRSRVAAAPVLQPADKMPKTSAFVLGLSIVSIPATYLTIFVSAFLVLGYSVLLLLALFELPRIPTIAIAAAVLAPLVAAWAALRAIGAIFFAKPPFQPAQLIPLAERPQLKRMVHEVCDAVGATAPDNVILHAEPTFFVTQQKMQTFDGVIKGRTLALGMPLLLHLTEQELKSILAHEFAHFSGRDTLYSSWVAPVFRSLGESINRLHGTMQQAQSWTQVLMNVLLTPSLWFLLIFLEYFASIDAIVSRSRELRADWIAVLHYGRAAFVSALQKVVQYSGHFAEHHAQFVLDGGPGYFQRFDALSQEDAGSLQQYLDDAMGAQENELDSHPTLATRIANVPDTQAADGEDGVAYRGELSEDEHKLSETYTAVLQQLRAFYAQAEQAATSGA